MAKTPEFKHTRVVIFSQEVAQNGIRGHIGELVMLRQLDSNVYLAVSSTRAEVFLNNLSPELEGNPAEYYEEIFSHGYIPYAPQTQLNTIFGHMGDESSDFALPLVGVSEASESGEISADTQDNIIDMPQQGDVRFSENKSESLGIAYFKDSALVDIGSGEDAVIFQILCGKSDTLYLSSYNAAGEEVSVKIIQHVSPRYKCEWAQGGIPKVNIKIMLSGELLAVSSKSNADDLKEAEQFIGAEVEKEVAAFLEKTARRYNADILYLGDRYKMKYLTIEAWKNQHFEERYKTAQFNVEVEVKLTRMGEIL